MDRGTEGGFIDVLLTLMWSTIGTALIPALIPWIIYVICNRTEIGKMKGMVVMITGSSSGLGEQLAHSFYKRGCKLILAARRVSELERVKNDLLDLVVEDVSTYEPVIVELDLADVKSIPRKVNNLLNTYGHIDYLINNGGISYRGKITETSIEVDQKVMLINYFGTVTLTKAVLPSMIEQRRGHIVAISSVQGRIAIPHRSAYSASKHALQAFMDCLRAEVSKDGINVTVINPGYIKTNLSVNAITGSGNKYGVMDETTSSGYEANEAAEKIYYSIAREDKEFTLAPLLPRIAIILRSFCPSLYFLLMKRRAMKLPPVHT
ncbi:dehydrogenase/reductase SDR family protein 7-like [Halyomorpha halys]|uniref:dehydrogenase/reductase SDR family protein 7-like n=1 Tax=Halyomorpha halys TaxID=286706 RepID=UPI0006D513F1|nr:dehydrogenase/reductase SDR family protein 7-like [Halyomorpha halys]